MSEDTSFMSNDNLSRTHRVALWIVPHILHTVHEMQFLNHFNCLPPELIPEKIPCKDKTPYNEEAAARIRAERRAKKAANWAKRQPKKLPPLFWPEQVEGLLRMSRE